MKILVFTTPELLIIRLDEISEREQQLLDQRGAPALIHLWNELQNQGPRKKRRLTGESILHLSRLHHNRPTVLAALSEAAKQTMAHWREPGVSVLVVEVAPRSWATSDSN